MLLYFVTNMLRKYFRKESEFLGNVKINLQFIFKLEEEVLNDNLKSKNKLVYFFGETEHGI